MGSSKKHKLGKIKHEKEKTDKERNDKEKYEKEKNKGKHEKLKERKKRELSRSRSRSREKEKSQKQKERSERDRKKRREGHAKELSYDERNLKSAKAERDSPTHIHKAGEISLSVEDTNKLRAKLGLKPLETGNKPTEGTGEDEDYLKKRKMSMCQQEEKLREKIENFKTKRQYDKRLLQVKTLGEIPDDNLDETAASWVLRNRQLQEEKELATKRAQILEEMDEEFGVGALIDKDWHERQAQAYSSKDLKGLVVEHSLERFKEGKEVILTLKDKEVLAEDGDTLVNVNLVDEEHYEKNVENLKRKPTYQPYEEAAEEEWDEQLGQPKPRSLLRKYDEEICGPKKDSFKLDDEHIGHLDADELERRMKERIRLKLMQHNVGVSLAMTPPQLASEFLTAEEAAVKFKKIKRKVKIRRKLRADDLLLSTSTLNNGLPASVKKDPDSPSEASVVVDVKNEPMEPADSVEETNFTEDDLLGPDEDLSQIILEPDEAEQELQWALNKARRLKQKEALYLNIEQQTVAAPPTEEQPVPALRGAIVMNETAEFCRSLGDIPTYGMSGNRDEDTEGIMDFEHEVAQQKGDEEENHKKSGWNEITIDAEEEFSDLKADSVTILEEEPDVGRGVAAALKLALSKGYLEREEKKMGTASCNIHLLRAQNYSIEDKNFGDDERLARRERYNGPLTDFKEKTGYRPDIKLEYIDDQGRLLSSKEAFRHLSHKFHGKASGKNKTEKRAKKLLQETLMKQMSSTDTPLATLSKLVRKQKETQSPFVVLSGSNKQGNF